MTIIDEGRRYWELKKVLEWWIVKEVILKKLTEEGKRYSLMRLLIKV